MVIKKFLSFLFWSSPYKLFWRGFEDACGFVDNLAGVVEKAWKTTASLEYMWITKTVLSTYIHSFPHLYHSP